jgi:hypothetical protein
MHTLPIAFFSVAVRVMSKGGKPGSMWQHCLHCAQWSNSTVVSGKSEAALAAEFGGYRPFAVHRNV